MASEDDWQLSQTSVLDRIKCLLKASHWSDCSFHVGDSYQVFSAHKVILASASPVFAAMFFGPVAEKSSVSVPDVEPDAFKLLLEYVYGDTVNFKTSDEACAVFYAAKKYMLPHLQSICREYLFNNLRARNACSLYEFAESVEEPELSKRCIQVICTHTNEVLSDPSFMELSLRTLLMVLDQDELNVDSELKLLKATLQWAATECVRNGCAITGGNQREFLGEALGKIRFLTLSPEEFITGLTQPDIFTSDEYVALHENLSFPGKCPLPAGISKVTQHRQHTPVRVTYCARQFFKNGLVTNGRAKLMTKIKVDRNVVVSGIRVSTKLPTEEVFASGSPPFVYEEDMEISVLDPDDTVLCKTLFCKQVEYNTLATALLSEPVHFQGGMEYGVVIILQGQYPMSFMSPTETSQNVKFDFCDYADVNGNGKFMSRSDMGFINAVVFSK